MLASDGESEKYSYLDIASIIESTAINTVQRDIKGLCKRMVFNVISGNRDDHLRNHGFIYKNNAWRLSSVYDLKYLLKRCLTR